MEALPEMVEVRIVGEDRQGQAGLGNARGAVEGARLNSVKVTSGTAVVQPY